MMSGRFVGGGVTHPVTDLFSIQYLLQAATLLFMTAKNGAFFLFVCFLTRDTYSRTDSERLKVGESALEITNRSSSVRALLRDTYACTRERDDCCLSRRVRREMGGGTQRADV